MGGRRLDGGWLVKAAPCGSESVMCVLVSGWMQGGGARISLHNHKGTAPAWGNLGLHNTHRRLEKKMSAMSRDKEGKPC